MTSIIDKLKNINLDNVDLSKIDFQSFLQSLMQRKDILVNIALIIATFFTVRYLSTIENSKMVMITNNLSQLEEKQKIVTKLEKEQEGLTALKKTMTEGLATETEIISAVLNLSQQQGVTVVDYTPTDSQVTESYSIQNVDFMFESTYAQMLALVRTIETYQKNLRINSWKKEAKDGYRQGQDDSQPSKSNDKIKWRISVSSITIKNDK